MSGDWKDMLADIDMSQLSPEEITELDELVNQLSVHDGSFREFIGHVKPDYEFYAHCEIIIDHLQALYDGDFRKLMIFCPPRHGKLIPYTTPVLTTKGWKNHGDLGLGDYVYGEFGQPVAVLSNNGVLLNMPQIEVEFFYGGSVITHPEHEWKVFDRADRQWKIRESQDFQVKRGPNVGGQYDRARYQLPVRPLLEGHHHIPNPYTLGYWLGDGKTNDRTICSNPEDAAAIKPHMEAESVIISPHKDHAVTGVKYWGALGADLPIGQYKRIPEYCFTAYEEDRRSLLQGLVDSDGSLDEKGRVRFVDINEDLVRDVQTLAISLGYRATVGLREAPDRDHYINGHKISEEQDLFVAQWTPHDGHPPGRLPRKAHTREFEPRKDGIRGIKPAPNQTGNCVSVEGGIYLVGRELRPTHNSETASRLFPAYYLSRNPNKNIIMSSSDKGLAQSDFSNHIRGFVESPPVNLPLAPENRGKELWTTQEGGGVLAKSVGATIIGFGADLLVLDDPISKREDALSKYKMDKLDDWYMSTAMRRLEPGGKVILTLQRWSDNDLAGRILEREPGQWTVLNLPAIAEDDDMMGREPGEALCPERYDIEDLENIRSNTSSTIFSAVYQQNPVPEGGLMFNGENCQYYRWIDEDLIRLGSQTLKPSDLPQYAAVDLAQTDTKDSDYSCLAHCAIGPNSELIVLHMEKWRAKSTVSEKKIIAFQAEHPNVQFVVVERSVGSIASIDELKKYMLIKDPSPISGKIDRAIPLSVYHERQLVYTPHPDDERWVTELEHELLRFPASRNDDQVDALVWAHDHMSEAKGTTDAAFVTAEEAEKILAKSRKEDPKPGQSRLFRWAQ